MSGERTAIGRHLEYLARRWSHTRTPFDRIVFMSPGALSVDDLGSETTLEMRTFAGGAPPLLWEQFHLPRAAREASVLFCEYVCPLRYDGRIVVANHGIYEAIPDTFSWWTRLRATPINRRSARRADRVIANSRSTRGDLVEYFGISPAKIDVVYPGPADLFFKQHRDDAVARAVSDVVGSDAPYVIFVGKIVTRRNVPNLMKAFAEVRRSESLPHHLLIVGPNVSRVSLDELAEQHQISAVVRHAPHLEQDVLALCYAGADVFALPTVYEGISWTMFEAMASGTAVLTVDHPTLSEGGGDSVLSVPTPSVDDLVGGLRKLLTDSKLRSDYAAKGRARARMFSLAQSADATLQILDAVATPVDLVG